MAKTATRLFYICVSVLFLALVFSCTKTDKNAVFLQKLGEIDLLIQDARNEKALKHLKKLRKSALFPVQYLSIAKRELTLRMPVEALQTIQTGLKKHPDDASLAAAAAAVLLKTQRLEDAVPYAALLKDTPYAGIGTEVFAENDKRHKTHNTPVSFWKTGFQLTREHRFLENAAVLLAGEGQIAQAAALRSLIPKTEALHSPYFWSCLAYDIGNFKPVLEELFYSLAYADMAGLPEDDPKVFEYARRHLLLAADASAGSDDMELARGYWQAYIDRYPNAAGDVFYNLAMTAPVEKERVRALIECITNEPVYYPAVAQYVRAWAMMQKKNAAEKNPLTDYLQSRDFFSLDMEKNLFLSSVFTLSAEDVLNNALQLQTDDPRFLLELFRYRYAQPDDYVQGNGEMWKILEKKPDVPLVKSYARWYFAHSGDFNASFTIEKTNNQFEDSFYDGIRHAIQGYSSKALDAFSFAEQDGRYSAYAAVNKGYIYEARTDYDLAIKSFLRAADQLKNNTVVKSKMLYEAARLFADRNGIEEAVSLLSKAISIDPENYRAATLKQRLDTIR